MFKPSNNITRAEAVTIINRILGRRTLLSSMPKELFTLYPDVDSSHWALADVIEALVEHDYSRGQLDYETWKVSSIQ